MNSLTRRQQFHGNESNSRRMPALKAGIRRRLEIDPWKKSRISTKTRNNALAADPTQDGRTRPQICSSYPLLNLLRLPGSQKARCAAESATEIFPFSSPAATAAGF